MAVNILGNFDVNASTHIHLNQFWRETFGGNFSRESVFNKNATGTDRSLGLQALSHASPILLPYFSNVPIHIAIHAIHLLVIPLVYVHIAGLEDVQGIRCAE